MKTKGSTGTSRRRKVQKIKKAPKPRGDLLQMMELSEDEGATTDEEGDHVDCYQECEHFIVQVKHSGDKLKQSKSKLKKSKKKTITVKVEVKKKQKPGPIKVKLDNVANAAKKKKQARKRKEVKRETGKTVETSVDELGDTEVHPSAETKTRKGVNMVIKQEQQSPEQEESKGKMETTINMGRKRKSKNDNEQPVKGKKARGTSSDIKDIVDTRTVDPNRKMFVGAHTSIAGGLYLAVLGAVEIEAHAFGLFLKSQRQWKSKPLEEDAAFKFKQACEKYGFLPHYILPHGSYLMNLGSPDEETLQKSRDMLVDELERCQKLGLTLFNFHPGSTCGKISVEKCIENIAESINLAHSRTSDVITVVENMSCQGNTVGGKFEELRAIIDKVKDKSRVGVCLDTCHAFAAGFDLSTQEGFDKFVHDFEVIVGFQYLKALHINDSKGAVGCHLDRHENIGKGFIGKEGFRRIMNFPKFQNIPMILETPPGLSDAKEVKMLYDMCKM